MRDLYKIVIVSLLWILGFVAFVLIIDYLGIPRDSITLAGGLVPQEKMTEAELRIIEQQMKDRVVGSISIMVPMVLAYCFLKWFRNDMRTLRPFP